MMMWKSAAVASAPPDGHSLQGVELTHVPYKGGGQQMNDALSGQFEVLSLSLIHI